MLDRIATFFRSLPGSEQRPSGLGGDDPRVAAAALLIHVMNADGVRQDVEWERIKQVLADTYTLSGSALDQLAAAGEAADNEAVDLYTFTSVLNRHLDEQARIEFIGLLWEVVFADGELHELEDNTLWRVAELIGVDRRDRIRTRQEAQRKATTPH
jgi:uncharacterized tellurite resistance protein B-like protein